VQLSAIGRIPRGLKGGPALARRGKKMGAKREEQDIFCLSRRRFIVVGRCLFMEEARDFCIWLYSLIFTCTHLY
jgi:hypothetical protein